MMKKRGKKRKKEKIYKLEEASDHCRADNVKKKKNVSFSFSGKDRCIA